MEGEVTFLLFLEYTFTIGGLTDPDHVSIENENVVEGDSYSSISSQNSLKPTMMLITLSNGI